MCNHSYFEFNFDGSNRKCEIQSYFPEKEILPIDDIGKCIFHSENVKWKINENFDHYLDLLIKSDIKETNLKDVVFIGINNENSISYFNSLQYSNFNSAKFKYCLKIENETFNSALDFSMVTFQSIHIKNCIFLETVEFSMIVFEENPLISQLFEISDCKFVKEFTMIYNDPFNANFNLVNCVFEGSVKITESNFHEELKVESTFKSTIEFSNNKILNRLADFSNSEFEEDVLFENNSINGICNLSNLKIDKNFILSGTESNKVFNGQVEFNIIPSIFSGHISFNNINFQSINLKHKEILINLQHQNKVTIGQGCIKYRLQTPTKTISIDRDSQALVVEMANTFKTYFSNAQNFNLGVEIIESTESYVRLFYFTDQNLTQREFKDIFKQVQLDFLSVIGGLSHSEGLQSTDQKTASNIFNTLMSVLSISAKSAFQKSLGKWDEEKSKALFDSIALKDQNIVDSKMAHQFISNIDWKFLLENSKQKNSPLNLNFITLQTGKNNFSIENMNGDIKDNSNT